MTRFCRNCGAELAEDARFCASCGNKVPDRKPETRICSGCGREAPSSASFCAACGANLTAPAAGSRNASNRVQPKTEIPQAKGQSSPGVPAYMQPGYQQRVRAERQAAQAPVKKGGRGLSLFLSIVLVAEFCVAGFKYPGFLREKGGGTGFFGITTGDPTGGNASSGQTAEGFAADLLAYFGMTETDYAEYLKDPIEATPENSPGNPDFLELSFTQAEYDAAKTLTAPVSRDDPTADFPEFGIHADLKWWNLENETDTLVVKRMPTKTVNGAQYYTYDYSLASGQSAFPTNVEITVPVQSPGGTPGNVLTTDPETGRWEEVYYTLSDDGKTYTLYMDHFTSGTEESDEEITLEDGTKVVANFTYENGKPIFDYVFREGAPKYENTGHYLYNVGVIKTPDLEKFLDHDTSRAVKILNDLVTKSGGVPAEAGLSEAVTGFGDSVDNTSFISSLMSLVPMSAEMAEGNSSGGLALGVVGAGILLLRIADQYSRGVSWDKIGSSNVWGFASTLVTVLGLPALGLPAAGIALAGCGIYVCSKVSAAQSQEERKKRILQNPRTIEEGAYDYFLYEYTRQIPDYVVVNDSAYAGVAGNDKAAYDISFAVTNVDAQGNLWASFMKDLFERYKSDPVMLIKVVEGVYSRFVSRYWTMDDRDKPFREACFRKALENIMNDGYAYTTVEAFGFTVKKEAEKLGISEEEYRRRAKIYYEINTNGKSIDDIVADWKAGKYPVDNVDVESYKARALGIVYQNTSEVLYSLYTSYYQDAFVEMKKKLRREVIPWLNTRLTFYWKDTDVKNGTFHTDSKYYQFLYQKEAPKYNFAFDCEHKTPLFQPGNETNPVFSLFLRPNSDNNILLETTIYNYLMWRCPKDVKIVKNGDNTAEAVRAKADFTGIVIKADPNSCFNGTSLVNIPSSKRNIKDIKVPILPDTKEAAKYSLLSMDDHGMSLFALENAGIIMESVLKETKLEMAKDGSFTVSGSGSRPTSIPRSAISSAIPMGDEEYDDPDPTEWTEMKGSRTLSFSLSGKYDAKSEKGTASLQGSGSGSDTYTAGHKSGNITNSTMSGSATFSGSTANVYRGNSNGRETLKISFFVHDENGKQVYDLYAYSTEGDSGETIENGWWLDLEFVKDD